MKPAQTIISVAVPAPLHQLFDYFVPADTNKEIIRPGMRLLVPFGHRKVTGIVMALKAESDTDLDKIKSAIAILDVAPTCPPPIIKMLNWASIYYCHPIGECYQTALPSIVRQSSKLPETDLIKWKRSEKVFAGPSNATQQRRILDFVSSQETGVWQDSLKLVNATPKQLQTLKDRGYLIEERLHALSRPDETVPRRQVTLNPDQKRIVAEIEKTKTFSVNLLEGITGSGKTEVYIKLVENLISRGGQALILIPEINLSPQTFARFQSQLSTPIAIIHSGLSEKEKYTSWMMAKQGIAKVIIGTRSAIFTPFEKLQLIVVDEEHDQSFKQMDGFKYSARDLAVKRGQLEDCPVLLGSATPSLESLFKAEQGDYAWLKLKRRAGAGQLPPLQLIDIRSRPLSNGCSPPLLQAIDQELESGNQVILFQNRRGFSPTLMCESCGEIMACHQCDARLTLHSQPPHLHCHHCDYKRAMPPACPKCSGTHLAPIGTGTERIEFGLAQRYPNTPIIRLDRDKIRNQDELEKALHQIRSGDPALIVGTQMLAKGHDFHHVTLVAVLDADGLFFSSDFRAIEKGAQQLTQISGRTGRGDKPGKVLVQTRLPEHPLFDHLSRHDYLSCALDQLEERKQCALPPVSKMIILRADAKEQQTNIEHLELVAHAIRGLALPQNALEIIGPIEANMARRKGLYRSQLCIIAHQTRVRTQVQRAIPAILNQYKSSKSRVSVDVDPLDYI